MRSHDACYAVSTHRILIPRGIEHIDVTPIESRVKHADRVIASWMRAYGVTFLRVSVAVVFIWFGLLKPLGMSPANELVERTVYWVDPHWFIPLDRKSVV
jgi:hypothetical protein